MTKKELKYVIDNHSGFYFKKYIFNNIEDKNHVKEFLHNKILDNKYHVRRFDLENKNKMNVIGIGKVDDLNTILMRKRDFYLRTLEAVKIAEMLAGNCYLGDNMNEKVIDISSEKYKEFCEYIKSDVHKFEILFKKKKEHLEKFEKEDNFKNYRILNSILNYAGLKIYKKQMRIDGKRVYKPFIKYNYVL